MGTNVWKRCPRARSHLRKNEERAPATQAHKNRFSIFSFSERDGGGGGGGGGLGKYNVRNDGTGNGNSPCGLW